MKNFKISDHNIILNRAGQTYLWNTRNGEFLRLDKEALAYYESFTGEEDETSHFKVLCQGGFIVRSRPILP